MPWGSGGVPDRGYPPGGTLTGYPPGGVPDRVPPRGGTWPGTPRGGTWPGTPPGGVPDRVPPGGYLTGYPPWGGYLTGYPPGGTWPGTPGGVPDRVPPPGGYPGRTTEGVLTTRRAVCLLRSRRRTFLFLYCFRKNFHHLVRVEADLRLSEGGYYVYLVRVVRPDDGSITPVLCANRINVQLFWCFQQTLRFC